MAPSLPAWRRHFPLDSAVGGSGKTNAADFHYIGRVTTNIDVGVARVSSGIKSIADVRAKPYTVGASGRGSTTDIYAEALNAYGGTKFKIVIGYKGTSEILLAMERGEVDIDGAYGLPGMLATHPEWIKRAKRRCCYQAALKRSELLPDVPTLGELAVSDEGKAILGAIASTAEIGRSIISGPGVPAGPAGGIARRFSARW